tara:strand:+ start:294 stop:578 length:285 start_codon:yes stop_codon:yes gene_type:complete
MEEINLDKFHKLVDLGAEIIDVREKSEYQDENINESKHWPLSSLNIRKREISQNTPSIFYCRSGLRSFQAAEIADSWTKQKVYSLKGGILKYKK